MHIIYVTPYAGEEEIVTSLLPEHTITFLAEPVFDSIPEALRGAEVLSVFVNSTVTEDMITSMPQLKVLALRSTGFDHVPVAFAQERGITVVYVPHYGSQTVAEHTFALMLALSRRVHPMYELLRREGNIDVAGFEGFDLCGKTLGIIGTGAIGKRVCEIAQGFRMNIKAFDVYPDENFAKERGFTYSTLAELLAESDIITFHVPATADNHHLLNTETIASMKPGAIVINTARGTLIDIVALMYAVKSGHLGGVGLDVFEGEEYLKDELKLLSLAPEAKNTDAFRAFIAEHELLDLPNAIITPHMAFNTKEAKREITETNASNITAALAGTPTFVVKLPV